MNEFILDAVISNTISVHKCWFGRKHVQWWSSFSLADICKPHTFVLWAKTSVRVIIWLRSNCKYNPKLIITIITKGSSCLSPERWVMLKIQHATKQWTWITRKLLNHQDTNLEKLHCRFGHKCGASPQMLQHLLLRHTSLNHKVSSLNQRCTIKYYLMTLIEFWNWHEIKL